MSRWMKIILPIFVIALVLMLIVLFTPVGETREEIALTGDVEHGTKLLQVAGCYACHTDTQRNDAELFAGGVKFETPFGDFYSPNITASKQYGLGDWTLPQFEAAVRQGRSPQGKPYYPAFPFSSYRGLTDQDVADLFVALQQTAPVETKSHSHKLNFPYNIRSGLKPWRWLFATTRRMSIDQSTLKGRGRYLVDVVAHCGECHNPRNSLGAFIPPYLGGNDQIPGGDWAPAIHGEALSQHEWTQDDLYYFLADGLKPDGDYAGGSMVEVIDYSTSQMSDEDREAIAAYLFSLRR
ncbi:MAG: cytochrome c [Reinekea sp.]|jgi:mono/diheme cytochrome c family protein